MKKTFKLIAAVAIASLTVVACNNNKPAEEVIDSTTIEQVVAEEVIEEPVQVADTVKQEATATKTNAATKKATKKAEVKEAGVNNTQTTTLEEPKEVKEVTGKVTKVERKRR